MVLIFTSGLSPNTLILEMIMTSYVASPQPKKPQQHLLLSPEAEQFVAAIMTSLPLKFLTARKALETK